MSVVQKYNIHTAKEKNVNSNYFTGKVKIREILSEENSPEQEMYHVTFYNGALTSLHYHESDQIFIANQRKRGCRACRGEAACQNLWSTSTVLHF